MGLDPMRAVIAALLVRRDGPRAAIAAVQLGNETGADPKPPRNNPDRITASNVTNNARA
jgi:hypothetical protein